MGCDIHIYAEEKVDGKWQVLPDRVYSSRNYDLFAILADVRNGHGIEPIKKPCGLPEDCSTEVFGHWMTCEGANCGHDVTYYGLQELIDGPWDKENYAKLAGYSFLDAINRLAKNHDPAHTRLVIWFDC